MHPFQTVQLGFAAYIRHPHRNPMPTGIEHRRMQIYARLFYNNIESFLTNTFPVFREITDDDRWHVLVRDFISGHRAESPYFSQIPEEFLQYLAARRDGQGEPGLTRTPQDGTSAECPPIPPFALELCHYEWVEMALDLAPDPDCEFDDDPVSIEDNLALSPLAWPLRYEYPVRRIGPHYQPDAPPDAPTWLIGWRNRHDRVRFMTSNAVTTRLLQLIDKGSANEKAFGTIAREIGTPLAQIRATGLDTLNRLHGHDIVVRR